MTIRTMTAADADAAAGLFREAVLRLCAGEYTPEQLAAWAAAADDRERWAASFAGHTALCAEIGGALAGFADLDGQYLDRLYVSPDFSGRGVATALCDALEPLAGGVISTHASKTIRPFLERRGYCVIRAQTVERRGVRLENYIMKKPL